MPNFDKLYEHAKRKEWNREVCEILYLWGSMDWNGDAGRI